MHKLIYMYMCMLITQCVLCSLSLSVSVSDGTHPLDVDIILVQLALSKFSLYHLGVCHALRVLSYHRPLGSQDCPLKAGRYCPDLLVYIDSIQCVYCYDIVFNN